MSGRSKTHYSGALNQPIVLPLGLLYRPTSIGAKGILRTRLIKLLLSLDHYNIKPNDPACWLKLAFLLAQDHVPGMKVVENTSRGRGAPLKPLDVSGARENVRIIDEIDHERKKGIPDAIRIALKRKQLKGSFRLFTRLYLPVIRCHQELVVCQQSRDLSPNRQN